MERVESKPKRILIFSLNYYPRYIGGAEVAIKEITDRIAPEDIEFHMVTLRVRRDVPKVEKIGNVLVHRIGFTASNPSIGDLRKFPLHLNKYYFQIGAYLKARSLHRQYRYDGIWAMMAHSCGIPAGLFKRAYPQVRYVLTLQEGDPPEAIERMMRPVWRLFKQGFTSADALQPISAFLQQWGERMGFRGSSRVIPNAVDVAKFARDYPTDAVQGMRAKLGKRDGDIYLVTTSRLVHKNAVDDVIRALPLLPPSVSFLIYGIGPDEAQLRALAQRLEVADRARFMGQISHDEMPVMLRACDIFIRPSRSEGMGNSFVEAFAAGIPVIATPAGGIPDFLFDPTANPGVPSTGIFCEVDNPQSIARAVEKYLADPALRADIVKNARALAIEKYDWNIIAADMKREVFDALESTPTRGN